MPNPPSKSVKLNTPDALRTTMTHVIVGDMVLVMTATADPEGYWVPAPGVAPKRAIWARVVDTARDIRVALPDSEATLAYTGNTAITIKDRSLAVAEVPITSTITVRPWVTAHVVPVETVTVTGSRVHREGAPCGTVHDDDTVNGVDTDAEADCVNCLSEPTELVAGDGSVIRVGSRVVIDAAASRYGEPQAGIVEALAELVDGAWGGLVTVRKDADGLPYGFYPSSLAAYVEKTVRGCVVCKLPVMPNGIDHGPCVARLAARAEAEATNDIPLMSMYAESVAAYMVTAFEYGYSVALRAVARYADIVDRGECSDIDIRHVGLEVHRAELVRTGLPVAFNPVPPNRRAAHGINDADVALLSGEPVPLVVMVPVTIEERPKGSAGSVWHACNGKRKSSRAYRRRKQVAAR